LRFGGSPETLRVHFMQAQDTTVFLYKLWPWIEANRNRLIGGAAALLVAVLFITYFSYRSGQQEIAAGEALTKLAVIPGGPTAEAYLKVAAEHPGTVAGQRALLQGATKLYDAGRYTDAQAQFQKFLDAHPDNQFSSRAALGVAACLDAQGKPEAVAAYQRVIGSSSDTAIVVAAKLALGRIKEAQGKLDDALIFYQDAARLGAGTSMGSDAAQRLAELRSKLPAPAPTTESAPAAAAPLQLSH
jgi:predicted negative regulator of RcsB-dependent stress response